MNVLAILGSPRENGNSEILLNAILAGVKKSDCNTEIIRLSSLDINPCISCGGCDETGECVVEDDMTPLYSKIINADRILLSSPIFFYGVTAQTKAFIDRCQALWNRKRLLRKKGMWTDDPEKKGFFISVAATKGAKVFDGAILCAKYGFDAMGFQYSGEFLFRGADKRGDMGKFADALRQAEWAGKDFFAGKPVLINISAADSP